MDRETARSYIAGMALSSAPVETPFWPDLDGLVSVRAMTGTESFAFEKAAADKGDTATGKVLVACILLTETKAPIFNATDFQFILDTVGIDILKPMFFKVLELSNMLKSQQSEAAVTA